MTKFLLILLWTLGLECSGQEIIDPVEIAPFNVVRRNAYAKLPARLGGAKTKGWAGITLTLTQQGAVTHVKLNRLKILSEEALDYTTGGLKNDRVEQFETF